MSENPSWRPICGRPVSYPARNCTREYGHEGAHWHSETHVQQHAIEQETRARIAKAVREHCTITDDEAMKRGGDFLIAAVAAWIENPPERVTL